MLRLERLSAAVQMTLYLFGSGTKVVLHNALGKWSQFYDRLLRKAKNNLPPKS